MGVPLWKHLLAPCTHPWLPQNVKPQRPTGSQVINLLSPRTSFITVSPGPEFARFLLVLVFCLQNILQCNEELILYLLCIIIRLHRLPRQFLIPDRSVPAARSWELAVQPVCPAPLGLPAVWGSRTTQRGRG